MKKALYILLLATLTFLTNCTTTEKILKSSDSNLKYTKALEWYNKGQYFKCIPVFEELMGLYKGEKSTEEIYFYYCMANYKQGSHLMAAYHFKNYTQKHPYSKYVEEAQFMHAESYKKQSLVYSLDQSETVNAIEAYQTFINIYPISERVTIANDKIDELRGRLEKKAIKAAELYFKTKNYRAAAVSYKNLLIDYPDVDGIEDIQFKIVKSYYKYAEQSIPSKQKERYEQSIKSGFTFINRYPSNENADQVVKLKEEANFNILKSSYNYAMTSSATKRSVLLDDFKNYYTLYFPELKEKNNIDIATNLLEKSYFQKIKTEYTLAQEVDQKNKSKHYQAAIDAYSVFSTKYSNSKFLNEAKRIFLASEKNYKKYNNG